MLAWAQRAGEGATVELACAEHPAAGRGPRDAVVARLPGCLADLHPHLPLELLVLGVGRVRLRLDGCTAAERAQQRHAGAAAFTAALPGDATVELVVRAPGGRSRPVHGAARMPVSRRAVLLLPERPLHLPPEHLTPHQRLRAAARELLGRVPDSPDLRSSLAAIVAEGFILRADGCVASGVCARSCPEDALTLSHTGQSAGPAILSIWPGRCSGCGTCLELCAAGALSPAGSPSWADLVHDPSLVLARVQTRTCARCGARFAPSRVGTAAPGAEEFCPVCRFRRATPFGSAPPPRRRPRG